MWSVPSAILGALVSKAGEMRIIASAANSSGSRVGGIYKLLDLRELTTFTVLYFCLGIEAITKRWLPLQ